MKFTWIIAAILLVAAGAYASIQLKQQPLALQTSFEYPAPIPLAPFSLIDQQGNRFSNEDLKGKWSLIFIGYTSCPDVCPTTMGKLTSAYTSLNQESDLQVIFMSVDPERDSTAKLDSYMNFFNPEFIALTGEHKQLFPVTRSLGFVYAMVGEGPDYQVDHSASFALVSPQGEKIAIIKPKSHKTGQLPQIKNSELIHDVNAIIGKYSG
ncbi:SCO family protein [Shewanella fidelis]|uniref:SCO family protein n=1 Tax=Shewanella fidelis TaxID=173509 RepID=A0AAW8NS40_9GAMM|nr:SCO family protein [Shewanella fidelis]MDR8525616.1 SCO family protein [Shewanella fidelis]MDW4812874.1 SCO family protein [Shewanella fidelis]MDW4816622.1 SCO family protein [Shewanella fidelis]MDW4820214.1 SCO family protein [Shewanella fidelis]MDW4825339.1 SCO family protein [Shewanella fidelis]